MTLRNHFSLISSAARRTRSLFLLLLAGVVGVCPAWAQAAGECVANRCLYQDSSLPVAQRARDLVRRMTLEEKVGQTLDHAPAIPRLGIPEYNWWNEGLHGVARNGVATVFPQAIGLAATWNADLVHQVADVISTEARAKYNEALRRNDHGRYAGITFWSPNVNIFRDPRWGRGQETYGEDPFLSARMGVAFVRGLQGADPKYLKLSATPKHFAVHSGPEIGRHGFNVSPSKHDLEDTYLPAFRATVMESRADAVMCAYNAVDTQPACASETLLQQRLRNLWKFKGYVVSDCDAVADIARGHRTAVDNAHAAAAAVKAGTDLNCGSAYKSLVDAAKTGLISEAEIDRSVERLFAARFRLGMFDPAENVSFNRIAISENNSPAHRQLALKAARESMVLLKNDGLLPLRSGTRKIAVIGPGAEVLEVLEGNYNGTAPDPVLPLEGIRKRFGSNAEVIYTPGSTFADGMPNPVPSSAFRPETGSKQQGLKAEYFDDPNFSGAPRVTRIDPAINFNWYRSAPAEGISSDRFAVRWTGEIIPPARGEYTISFRGAKASRDASEEPANGAARQGVRVYLDGNLLLDTAKPSATVSFADVQPHQIRVEYSRVTDDRYVQLQWQPPVRPLLDAAVQVAKSADVVVAFVGLSPNLEGEEMKVQVNGFNGGDRADLGLPAVQEQLLEAVGATGKPLVVVLTSGSAVAVNWASAHANAVLQAWYPGEEGGTAIAETLAGDNNPAGRLPVTFYRSAGDLPSFTDYSMANRTYRYYRGSVLYPFGHGLSYSTFAYQNVKLSRRSLKAGSALTVTVKVANTSSREGDEVVQLYLKPPRTAAGPNLALQGFQRVRLAPGESKQVQFQLDARQLSQVDAEGKRAVRSGAYTVFVGGGQPGYSRGVVNSDFHITGNLAIAD